MQAKKKAGKTWWLLTCALPFALPSEAAGETDTDERYLRPRTLPCRPRAGVPMAPIGEENMPQELP